MGPKAADVFGLLVELAGNEDEDRAHDDREMPQDPVLEAMLAGEVEARQLKRVVSELEEAGTVHYLLLPRVWEALSPGGIRGPAGFPGSSAQYRQFRRLVNAEVQSVRCPLVMLLHAYHMGKEQPTFATIAKEDADVEMSEAHTEAQHRQSRSEIIAALDERVGLPLTACDAAHVALAKKRMRDAEDSYKITLALHKQNRAEQAEQEKAAKKARAEAKAEANKGKAKGKARSSTVAS